MRWFHFWLSIWTATAFHDDDCEATEDATSVVPWRSLRQQLKDGCAAANIQLLPDLTALRKSAECELGAAAVCLCRAQVSTAAVCVKQISLQRMLATRWPLLKLLAQLQQSGDAASSCIGLWHPSLDWEEWRHQVTAFAEEAPRWLDGLVEEPLSFDETLGAAHGVVWKSSSDAVSEGHTIAMWTSMCPLGVLSAFAVRAVSLVLGHSDVYRIVQRAIETADRAMSNLEDILQSSWPIFQVLHVMSLLKRSLHDTRLTAADLEAATPAAERSPLWQRAVWPLTRAADASGMNLVMMTGLFAERAGHLLDLFKHADRFGYLAPLVLVPMLPNLTATCETIAELFLQRRDNPWQSPWTPCLPFVSQFRAQYLYLHLVLQLDLRVLWFDFHVVLLQSPFVWLPDALEGRLDLPSYREPCQRYCATSGPPDVYLADEFYAPFLVKPTMMLLRPTNATKHWLQGFLHWFSTFPFAHEARGLQYMVFPDRLDIIPSVSMLPSKEEVPMIKLGELDSEQHFVGTDGWFGEVPIFQCWFGRWL